MTKILEFNKINFVKFFIFTTVFLTCLIINFKSYGANQQVKADENPKIVINNENYIYSPNTNTNTNINNNKSIQNNQSYSPSNSLIRNYGNTKCAPSLQRNLYLDQVWSNLVLRDKLYVDPALSKIKPKDKELPSYVTKYRAKAVKTTTVKTKTATKSEVNKSLVNTNNEAQNNSNMLDGKLKLESGTHVIIDPGAHVVVWANDKKTEISNNEEKTSENNNASEIKLVEIPTPDIKTE